MAFLLQYNILSCSIVSMPKIIARNKRKTVNVQVMLTESDGKKLRSLVKKEGTTVSDLLRAMVKERLEAPCSAT